MYETAKSRKRLAKGCGTTLRLYPTRGQDLIHGKDGNAHPGARTGRCCNTKDIMEEYATNGDLLTRLTLKKTKKIIKSKGSPKRQMDELSRASAQNCRKAGTTKEVMTTPWEEAAPSPTQDPHAHSATFPNINSAARSGNKGAQPMTRPATSAES